MPQTSRVSFTPTPSLRACLAIAEGSLDVKLDDRRLLGRESFVYDALYAWCQRNIR